MNILEDWDIIIGWCKMKSRDIDEAILDSVKEKFIPFLKALR